MDTISCNEFLNDVDASLEGEQSPEAAAHIRDCARCRAMVDDLGAIRSVAIASSKDDPEPPARIWIALRAQLEQEGLIHDGRAERNHGLAGALDRWFGPLARPALAGAYLALLVVIGGALVANSNRESNDDRWLARTQVGTTPLNKQLNVAEQATLSTFPDSNPVVTASLNKNLAIVDNYIALCEKSVREEPENEDARDYLYEAYQQKADLLAEMNERGYGQ
jgi:hypothetical protein